MRAKRVVIWLAFVLTLLGLLLAGLWYARLRTAGGTASDPSYGLITSPLSGDVVLIGDPVYVDANFLLSHRNPASVELYVDGEKYVLDDQAQAAPECSSSDAKFCGLINARMLWIPTDAGMYSVSACVAADESEGAKWTVCADAAKLRVIDLNGPPEIGGSYVPQPGDTLESVAGKFGLPPLFVAAGNPGIEPAAPLPADTVINIPPDPSLDESSDGPSRVDKVTMTVDLPVDKVYCYYSLGENYWARLPASPQSFVYPLSGQLDLTSYFRTIPIPPAGGSLALECWGWSGTALVPLGSGKTDLGPAGSTSIQLRGDHFVLDVDLIVIPDSGEIRGPTLIIPPPQALTNTNNVDVCINHFPAGFVQVFVGVPACKAAIEPAPEKGKYVSDNILVWEWLTPLFPPDDPKISWLTEIEGYHVYQINSTGKPALIKTITNKDWKVLMLPAKKSPPASTYFVRAFSGTLESADSNHYTIGGTTSGLATVTISPVPFSEDALSLHTDVLTDSMDLCGEPWTIIESFDSGGTAIPAGDFFADGKNVAVGFHWFYNDGDCPSMVMQLLGGSVRFKLDSIKGAVSKAVLTYRQGRSLISGSSAGVLPAGSSCAEWINTVDAVSGGAVSASSKFAFIGVSGSEGLTRTADVTVAVRNWMLGEPNLGFVLISRPDSGGAYDDPDQCVTSYGDFVLTVTYFVP